MWPHRLSLRWVEKHLMRSETSCHPLQRERGGEKRKSRKLGSTGIKRKIYVIDGADKEWIDACDGKREPTKEGTIDEMR